MGKILREPLLHFLVLGALIFACVSLTSHKGTSAPETILVTRGRIASLGTAFARTWQRPPTQAELDALIRDYIREEISVREAVALGLDRDDPILRRRLQQKLEFISQDLIVQAEPTDDDLRAHLRDHPEPFRGKTGVVPELADVRDDVRRDWASARRAEANEKLYRELLTRYTVTVEPSPK